MSKSMRKKLEPNEIDLSLLNLNDNKIGTKIDEYSIYNNEASQSDIEEEKAEESSFELEPDDHESSEQQRKNIQKLLDRLGLKTAHGGNSKNQDLELVVNNFVENCIETVDHVANIEEYDHEYDSLYQDRLKAQEPQLSSIYISELTQLEAILRIDNRGIKAIYRTIGLACRYISMTCEKIIQHPIFEGFILTIIMLNSLKMATDDPLSTVSSLPWVETTFTAIYVTEMSLKIMAFGFIFNKGSYLRDMWNIMDFFIVITSLLPIVINLGFSVSALRAFRVLRPLRTITKIKALKQIMKTLFYSFSLVMDSIYILLFVIFVFAIAGMQLFGGNLKDVCMSSATGALTTTLCSSTSDCGSLQLCVKGISSPNFSVNNFDTIFWSAINVFQSITLQGWGTVMQEIQMVSGFIYCLYSLLIVFICEYVLLNMTLAILKYKYSQVKDNLIEEEQEEKEEYSPDFLKKIGIFQELSVLSRPQLLARANNPSKHQLGCARTLPSKDHIASVTVNSLIRYLDQAKLSEKIIDTQKPSINMVQLRQLGKLVEYKWDAKQLEFEANILNEKEGGVLLQNLDEKPPSDHTLEGKEDSQEFLDESFDSSMEELLESSDEELSEKEQQLAEMALEAQERFNKPSSACENDINITLKQKQQAQLEIEVKVKPVKEISDLDRLLSLIGGKPGTTKIQQIQAQIPDIDMKQIVAERVFERFADLGDFSLKRANKTNELKLLDIPAAQKNMHKLNKHKQPPIQAVIEESALDLKELHLKNELEKKVLRCRIKPDELIDKQRRYDVMRVSVSLQLKEVEQKREQIKENMNTLHFNVRYRPPPDKKEAGGSIYARNLQNQKLILKIPEVGSGAQQSVKRQEKDRSNSHKTRDNSKYLKLLQNYQMEDRIEMSFDRVMAIFFKTEFPKKQAEPPKMTSQEEYELILEEDILKRHGHLDIEFPVNSLQEEGEILEILNMRKEEYEINIRGIEGFWRVARKQTLLFVSSSPYDNFILFIVIANTLLMSLSGFVETDNQPYSTISLIFTIFFVIDLSIKVFAYGISFFSDVMNLFDTGVVAISLVEITLGGSNLSALRSIRILRAFRVLRITRLIRSLNYMRIIMNVITSVINEFVYVFLLLFLFIFIFTLLGMQIFGGAFVPQSVSGIRQNYDTFFNAFFVVFQVMTIENWNDIETATCLSTVGPWGVLFLVSWIFLGNWILLSLLQAILLDGFDDDATDPNEESTTESQEKLSETEVKSIQDSYQALSEDLSSQDESETSTKKEIKFDIEDASLFIFKPNNPFRQFATWIINSTAFEVVMFIIILFSSGKLALDTYIDGETGQLVDIAQLCDYVLNFIFITECTLKIVARGFIVGEDSYLRNSWNRLDFFIVCISILDMILSGINLSIIKLLRTLRPLRIITRNEDMKVMVTSLMQSILGIMNLLIIVMCVFLMFAILGMNLLQGKLDYCNVGGEKLVTGSYGPYGVIQSDCIAQGGTWVTQLINFQNVVNSMLSLYVFSTRQNWPFYVYSFIDASETGPVKDNNQILYFGFAILFIFVCSLFFMDLLVGVLFTNYHESESKIRPKTLSNKQINWKNLQKLIVSEDPCFQLYIAPENGLRRMLFNIVSTNVFEIAIACLIIFNIIVMSLANDDISSSQQALLDSLNSACSYIFIAELGLKLVTFGKAYFLSVWNLFDFFVVSASILDLILHYLGIGSGSKSATLSLLPQIARIFRVMRITRLLRMLKRFKGLQKLIETFIFSLPAISKAFSILLLYLFIAAILASNIMGGIVKDYSGAFSSILNYQDFHNSIQTLFVNLSGQNWYYYMFFSTKQGYSECNGTTSCESSFYYLFWLPFQFFGQKVFLELFVLIVLDQFEENYINQHNPLGIFSLYEDDFREKWIATTVKYHSEKIETKHLINLMLALRPPLGLGRQETLAKYKSELEDNDKSTPEEIETKMGELDQKLKKNAAFLLNKMNLMKNRIYFGYHETFYHFIKLATVPEFIADATPDQVKLIEQMHKESEQALDKLKPAGNLFYFGELQGEDEKSEPLNPISLILFTQMIVKGWHNYSLRSKNAARKKEGDYNPFDSLNDSCASDLNEAQYEKIAPEKRVAIRRGGLMQNKFSQKCEFQPTNSICGAYQEGKKTKNKISFRSSRISNTKKQKESKRHSKELRFTIKSGSRNSRMFPDDESSFN